MKRMVRTLVYVGPDFWIEEMQNKRGVKGLMDLGGGKLISESHQPFLTVLAEDTAEDRMEAVTLAFKRLTGHQKQIWLGALESTS